ncbi:MAG TPA: response regulator, partial [Pirellula sp.]|nr:response regulator [Pirellula sp.]
MAIHELTTNAAKYGSLSTTEGRLEIVWQTTPDDQNVSFRWHESGGPIVRPPSRNGFGKFLLERALATDLQGTVQLDFAQQGLRCLINFPIENCAVNAEDGMLHPSAVPHPESKPPRENGAKHLETTRPRILIVEDEFLLAMELQETLQSKNYFVVGPYHDLIRAREAASRERIDLALLDTNLNGEMVFPFADELLARGVACILVTGYGASNLPEKFRGLPRVSKPYSPVALAVEVAKALENLGLASASSTVGTVAINPEASVI